MVYFGTCTVPCGTKQTLPAVVYFGTCTVPCGTKQTLPAMVYFGTGTVFCRTKKTLHTVVYFGSCSVPCGTKQYIPVSFLWEHAAWFYLRRNLGKQNKGKVSRLSIDCHIILRALRPRWKYHKRLRHPKPISAFGKWRDRSKLLALRHAMLGLCAALWYSVIPSEPSPSSDFIRAKSFMSRQALLHINRSVDASDGMHATWTVQILIHQWPKIDTQLSQSLGIPWNGKHSRHMTR